MGLEWQMVDEKLGDEGKVVAWLERGFEPFAVDRGLVFLKKVVVTERDEPRSSVHPQNANLAGNEPDAAE